jgi:hypothetical protein
LQQHREQRIPVCSGTGLLEVPSGQVPREPDEVASQLVSYTGAQVVGAERDANGDAAATAVQTGARVCSQLRSLWHRWAAVMPKLLSCREAGHQHPMQPAGHLPCAHQISPENLDRPWTATTMSYSQADEVTPTCQKGALLLATKPGCVETMQQGTRFQPRFTDQRPDHSAGCRPQAARTGSVAGEPCADRAAGGAADAAAANRSVARPPNGANRGGDG